MMTRTRHTRIKSGLILAMAVVFLLSMTVFSLALIGERQSMMGTTADAEVTVESTSINYDDVFENDPDCQTIGNSDVETFLNKTNTKKELCNPDRNDGIVNTPEEFCYVFFMGTGGEFTLGANFKISATNWSENTKGLPSLPGGKLHGAGYIIWNDAIAVTPCTQSSVLGGLVSTNKAEIDNLIYYFSGKLSVTKCASSADIEVGGMIGKNATDGKLINCRLESTGEIVSEAKAESVASYIGGLIGLNSGGTITNTRIISNTSLEGYSERDFKEEEPTAKYNKIYVGGVIGAMTAGTISGSKVKTSGNVLAADNINSWTEEDSIVGQGISFIKEKASGVPVLGGIVESLDPSLARNGADAVHPAGCFIGMLSGTGKVENNDLKISGSAVSYGMAGSGEEGGIAGGIVGLFDASLSTTATSISKNSITMDCALNSFWVEKFTIIGTIASWITKEMTNTYIGAIVGKTLTSDQTPNSALSMKHNYVYINKDSGIIEDGADFDNDTYACYAGLLCGNTELNRFVGENNWLSRNLSECDTGRIAGNEVDGGGINHLCVFGDGDVSISGTITTGTITVVAKPSHSPFRGWTSTLSAATPTWNTDRTIALTSGTNNIRFAVFIDEEISSSGELTQFAKDVNLIQKSVWKHLGSQNIVGEGESAKWDHKFYYSSIQDITLRWLNVKLMNDILVSKGTPVIEDFHGTFDGCGYKITFSSESKITHDAEKERSDKSVATGLFGTLSSTAVVKNLDILFGGSISEPDGLKFKKIDDADDKLKDLRDDDMEKEDSMRVVQGHTCAVGDFTLPDSLSNDTCYMFFLNGTEYTVDAEQNPGYVTIVPYLCEVIVENHYVGILAGMNHGRIENVSVEASKAASVSCTANKTYFGTLCGYNSGSIVTASGTMRGRVALTSRAEGYAGGLIGSNCPSEGAVYSGLNSYVAGEVRLSSAWTYYLVTYYAYRKSATSENSDVPAGYTEDDRFAHDHYGETEKFSFWIKNSDMMATRTVRIRDLDPTVVKEVIGALIGYHAAKDTTFENFAAVAGTKGNLNTDVFNTDSTDATIGAVIGYVKIGDPEKEENQNTPTFTNGWAVMSHKENFDEQNPGMTGRKVIGNGSYVEKTKVNLVYVESTVAVSHISPYAQNPVSFTLEESEGKTFSGWYDYTNNQRTVVDAGFDGTYLTPQQPVENKIYTVELVSLQVADKETLNRISSSTNEGRMYTGIEFTLVADLTLDSDFTPIGTEEKPFNGTFDGNGLSLTTDTISANEGLVGVFGWIGEEGTIKGLTVRVAKLFGGDDVYAAGTIAAVNQGTIGQARSTGKVIAEIGSTVQAATYVGGLVGINYGTVMNAEVHFTGNGKVEATSESREQRGYAGGAIGLNESLAKNIIVSARDLAQGKVPVDSGNNTCTLGGVIGENVASAQAYSLVSILKEEKEIGNQMGSEGSVGVYLAALIGNNLSNRVDSLWCLYIDAAQLSSGIFGDPVKVYTDNESSYPDVSDKIVLMNGTKHLSANMLIQYGFGTVNVDIIHLDSDKGGKVSFTSQRDAEAGMDFYGYVASFEAGTRVTVDEGNIGYTFSPASTLEGKVYYAGFANSSIASQKDYKELASVINDKNYKLYVNYNLTASFVLNTESPVSIGTAGSPFCGSINGNGYTVTMTSELNHAFIGVLGDPNNRYSEIKNLRFNVQPTALITEAGDGICRGFLTDVNNGVISTLTMNLRGVLLNVNGAIGAVAGENNGTILSATLVIEYASYLEDVGFGMLYGKTVGGLVGVNNGTIGSDTTNAIDITISKGGSFGGVLYGTQAAGALVGKNGATGLVRSTAVFLNGGTLVGGYVSALVGENEGEIEESFINVGKDAVYAATSAFGMIAGKNLGVIGDESLDGFAEKIRAFLYSAPYVGEGFTFKPGITTGTFETPTIGGAVGVNDAIVGGAVGVISSTSVELHDSIRAVDYAGGLAGENKGLIEYSSLIGYAGTEIDALYAGGIAAKSSGRMLGVTAVLRGNVGSESTVVAGGIAAELIYGGTTHEAGNTIIRGGVQDSAITLYGEVVGASSALAAPMVSCGAGIDEPADLGVNAWVQVSNASALSTADEGESRGFNVLRVLNDELFTATIESDRTILFTSLYSVEEWYTDISTWQILSDGEGASVNDYELIPSKSNANVTYYACFDDLNIRVASDLVRMSNLINSHSYYRNVLFKQINDIDLTSGTMLRPIGTEQYPFNAIFDGGYFTITLWEGSGISAAEYSGLFGYTASNSTIKNFILRIEKNVYIGGVSSWEIGALVGHSEGIIRNVFVTLSSKILSHSSTDARTAFVGAFAGKVIPNGEGNPIVNSWISILNDAAPSSVGNMTESAFGLNSIGVLGDGGTIIEFVTRGENPTVKFYVPNSANFAAFDGWYSDIGNAVKLTGSAYELQSDKIGKNIFWIPEAGQSDRTVNLSFIELVINDNDSFARFVHNINTYGDQGARFRLEANLVLEYDESLASIGTAERPFTGIFDGQGHTLTVVGNLIKRDYAGIFGVVGQSGVVKNLFIDVSGTSKFGDNSTIYSGIAVALLYGEIRNVVVKVGADVTVFTTQGISSYGGIVGRAGKVLAQNGAGAITEGISYKIDNAWLLLAENTTVKNPVGEDTYYLRKKDECGEGRVMQLVGRTVALRVTISEECIVFNANENGTNFYGFIDNNNVTDTTVSSIHDASSNKIWTVYKGDIDKNGDPTSTSMLCIGIKTEVRTQEDLNIVAENVRLGRNYRGITYTLLNDIVLDEDFTPIGGVVPLADGSYVECEFVGGFNGNGHTVTLPEDVTIDARYAGLFGRIGASARVFDLTIVAEGNVGCDTGDNTTRTLYAGVLAGYAKAGSSYWNVVVVLGRRASLYGSLGTGRTFGYMSEALTESLIADGDEYKSISEFTRYLRKTVKNAQEEYEIQYQEDAKGNYIRLSDGEYVSVYKAFGSGAFNCWAICYNSKENHLLNAQEQNQGIINTIMVVAAGSVSPIRDESNYADISFAYTPEYEAQSADIYRYLMDAEMIEENDLATENEKTTKTFLPNANPKGEKYKVSFLNGDIGDIDDLKKYATAVNNGYNFYDLTFYLTADITIEKNSGFEPIGDERSSMNGIFDGQGHAITLAADAVINGRYAGIFGSVAADGTIKNLIINLYGRIGNSDIDESVLATGEVNARYAGAVAYNRGRLENVVFVEKGAVLRTMQNGVSGMAIAYDETNLVQNVWALVDASSYLPTIGTVVGGVSGVNTMKIIGKGDVSVAFEANYQITFTAVDIPVMGWYRSFEKNQQLSAAMIEGLTNGEGGSLTAPAEAFGVQYEVAVIKTTIENVDDIVALAKDVNVGGYTFESVTFNLGKDISFNAFGFVSIGTAEHPFKGTFLGSLDGDYYTITYNSRADNKSIDGLFGYNAGVIRDLHLIVHGIVGEYETDSDRVYGALAMYNLGTIENSVVEIAETGKVLGYTVGGMVGINSGTISDSVVILRGEVRAYSAEGKTLNAGGIVGYNSGVVEGSKSFADWKTRGILPTYLLDGAETEMEANLFLYGLVIAEGKTVNDTANAGGAIGNNAIGATLEGLIEYVIKADGAAVKAMDGGAVRAGGLVGYSRSAVNHNVIFLFGRVEANAIDAEGDVCRGDAAGYLHGVTAMNTWLITKAASPVATGRGSKSVNTLIVRGDGRIKISIDAVTKNILFSNNNDRDGAKLNGWYVGTSYKREGATYEEWKGSVKVDSKIGNVGENGNTFVPQVGVQNKTVLAIFVNTMIDSVADLIDMAESVSAGLTGVEFTLEADLTITAEDALQVIGTKEAPFENVFDGKNHTITFYRGAFDSMIGKESDIALFGYTGATSKISNLHLIVDPRASAEEVGAPTAVFGGDAVNRMAILVAYAEGSVDHVTLTVREGVEIVGRVAAGLVASFMSDDEKISDVQYFLYGKITASSATESNILAGGLVGTNSGIIENAEITVGENAVVASTDAFTVYAGAIVGENYNKISHVSVSFLGAFDLTGNLAYAGVIAGLNLGTIENAYVEIGENASFGASSVTAGGLVGNNVNTIKNSLVKAVGVSLGENHDSAVGALRAQSVIDNVWIYTDDLSVFSSAADVNCITCDSENGYSLTCPTKAEVLQGKIAFRGNVLTDRNAFSLFRNVTGNGAAIKNVSYDTVEGKLRYVAYDESILNPGTENEKVIITPKSIKGVKVCLLSRNDIGSGSELYAFEMAIDSGLYTWDEAIFTVTEDFSLPTTEEMPTDVFPSIALPSGVTFDGGHHVITVGNTILSNGLFASNEGTIKRLGLRLTATDDVLVADNSGTLEHSVVYLEDAVAFSAEKNYFAQGGTVTNCWLVVRGDYEADDFAAVTYPVIRIVGEGTLIESGEENVVFTVAENDALKFVGYSYNGAIVLTNATFNTAEMIDLYGVAYYTVEFLSYEIDSIEDLLAVGEATRLGYDGTGDTYTLKADLLVGETLFKYATSFKGTINGDGHTLRATDAVTDSLFGAFDGSINHIRIDLSALSESDVSLFASGAAATMSYSVVTEARSALALGMEEVSSWRDVWIDTNNKTLYDTFPTNRKISVLYRQSDAVSYELTQSAVIVGMDDTSEKVFAGWCAGEIDYSARTADVYGRNAKHLELPAGGGDRIYLNAIRCELLAQSDVEQLAQAVTGGFDFAGVRFTVKNRIEIKCEIDHAIASIGDQNHPFKGTIAGDGVGAEIAFVAPDDIPDVDYVNYVNPFVYLLEGEIRDLLISYDDKTDFANLEGGKGAVFMNHSGSLKSVVVYFRKASNSCFYKRGIGTLNNCWVVTETDHSILTGVNQIYLEKAGLIVEMNGDHIRFSFEQDAGTFLALYDFAMLVEATGDYDPDETYYTAAGAVVEHPTAEDFEAGNYYVLASIDPPENFDTKAMAYRASQLVEYALGGARERGVTRLSVKGANKIRDEHELRYLLYQANSEKLLSDEEYVLTIRFANDFEVKGSYQEKLVANGLIFDLQGHTLTLSEGIFTLKDRVGAGTIRNGSIRLKYSDGIGSEGLTLENVTLFLLRNDIELPAYHVGNDVMIIASEQRVQPVNSGTYNYYYLPQGALVTVEYDKIVDEEGNVVYDEEGNATYEASYSGEDNDLYWFVAVIREGYASRGLYAPTKIRTEADYLLFVEASNYASDRLLGDRIVLEMDLEFLPTAAHLLSGFQGILDAEGHSIVLTGGTLADAFLDVAEEGSISHLRVLVRKTVTVTAETKVVSLASPSTSSVALIYYLKDDQITIEKKVAGTESDFNGSLYVSSDCATVYVYGEGEILTTFGEGQIDFTAVEDAEETQLALRAWLELPDEGTKLTLVGAEKNPDLTQSLGNGEVLCAYFEEAYFVSIHYVSVDDLGEAFNGEYILPNVKVATKYFSDDLTTEGDKRYALIEASYPSDAGIGNGTVFFGLEVLDRDMGSTASTDTTNTFKLYLKDEHEVWLNVKVEYLNLPWISVDYSGECVDYETLLLREDVDLYEAYRAIYEKAVEAPYDHEVIYEPLAGTPALVVNPEDGKLYPYHAGEYIVKVIYSKTENGTKYYMGMASCGLVINKAILKVTPTFENKVYDGTVAATASDWIVNGWKAGDDAYAEIDSDGLFTFDDANIGVLKPISVHITKLGLKPISGYTYLDYEVVLDGTFYATISPKPVTFAVPLREVEYLAQTGRAFDANYFSAFYENVRSVFGDDPAVLAAFEEAENYLSEQGLELLKTEKTGILDVGYYRILLDNQVWSALVNRYPVLANYTVSLAGNLYYHVDKSYVKFVFNACTVTYGDTFVPEYDFFVGENEEDGRTYLALPDWAERPVIGRVRLVRTLTPKKVNGEYVSDSYAFTYVFTEANKNYTVVATKYESVNGYSLPVLDGSVTVTVEPKTIHVIATGNEKTFGTADGTLHARMTENTVLEAGHSLVVTRVDSGETVGRYKLRVSVKDADGVDVSDYYVIPERENYTFEIKKATLTIRVNKQFVTFGAANATINNAINATPAVKGASLTDIRTLLGISNSKDSVTIADLGVSLRFLLPNELLSVGTHDLGIEMTCLDKTKENLNVEIVGLRDNILPNAVIVQAREIVVTIKDMTKDAYDGKNDFVDVFSRQAQKDRYSISKADADLLKSQGITIEDTYSLKSGGVSVGSYKIDGEFKLMYANGEEETENYQLRVKQGTYTINRRNVEVTATVGYFSETGKFTPAEKVYFGDSKAELCYTSDDLYTVISMVGTDREVSDRIASELKIVSQKLTRYMPDDVISPVGGSGNYNVTVACAAKISPVKLTVKLSSGAKKTGDPDPGIKWELVATDLETNQVIENYNELTEGTFEVTVSATRKSGEALGAYSYEDVKVDIVDTAMGISLSDLDTEAGKAFAQTSAVVVEQPANLELVITQEGVAENKTVEYVIYGVAIAGIAIVVVFLLIILPIIIKKVKAKKKEKMARQEEAQRAADAAAPIEDGTMTDEEISRVLDEPDEEPEEDDQSEEIEIPTQDEDPDDEE